MLHTDSDWRAGLSRCAGMGLVERDEGVKSCRGAGGQGGRGRVGGGVGEHEALRDVLVVV